jgi:hypothetical protein
MATRASGDRVAGDGFVCAPATRMPFGAFRA